MRWEYPGPIRVLAHIMSAKAISEERRVTNALALLLGWYVVFGVAGYVVLRLTPRDTGLPLLLAPIAAVAAGIVAPTTLAVLALSNRRLSWPLLATLAAAAGLLFVVVATLIALALRG